MTVAVFHGGFDGSAVDRGRHPVWALRVGDAVQVGDEWSTITAITVVGHGNGWNMGFPSGHLQRLRITTDAGHFDAWECEWVKAKLAREAR